MISSLLGKIEKMGPQELCVHVQGVGYRVTVPPVLWENLVDGVTKQLLIESYIREDRFDLYGFTTKEDRVLFQKLTAISGIGPKIALEICSLPRAELHRAILHSDARALSAIKGIGAKRAEKILPDLKSICEDYPEIITTSGEAYQPMTSGDDDAITALTALGYERATVQKALRSLPKDVTRTEDRVAAVLRSL